MEDKSRIWGISDVKAFLISIITGFILVTIVAVIFTEISNETVNKTGCWILCRQELIPMNTLYRMIKLKACTGFLIRHRNW